MGGERSRSRVCQSTQILVPLPICVQNNSLSQITSPPRLNRQLQKKAIPERIKVGQVCTDLLLYLRLERGVNHVLWTPNQVCRCGRWHRGQNLHAHLIHNRQFPRRICTYSVSLKSKKMRKISSKVQLFNH